MTTELATTEPQPHGSALALSSEQDWWNDKQLAALRQMGLDKAGNGDLAVFMHVTQRTGLDPFARQIYMIGRNSKENIGGEWKWVTKYTIQTGIDGFRLVARRASDRLGETLEYEDTQWCDAEGNWTDVWTKATAPTGARVTVLRHGKRFPAVALYREYVQTNRDGNPNAMWARMPANQIAKCAEALALRKAFPQDLSGVYADEEMGQADRPPRRESEPAPAPERMRAMLGTDDDSPAAAGVEATGGEPATSPPESPTLDMRSKLARHMFAALNEANITDDTAQRDRVAEIIGRPITSRKELTDADAEQVIAALDQPDADEDYRAAVAAQDAGTGEQ